MTRLTSTGIWKLYVAGVLMRRRDSRAPVMSTFNYDASATRWNAIFKRNSTNDAGLLFFAR
jgi:hypothetical protein